MSFNKNTWSKDYSDANGIKMLGAIDAKAKGFEPKVSKGKRKTPALTSSSKKEVSSSS